MRRLLQVLAGLIVGLALAEGGMEVYFPLAAQFRTQDEPAYCGLSTLVMALNALAIDPGKTWKGVWRWYAEEMLECCAPLEVGTRCVAVAPVSPRLTRSLPLLR